ncbi:MULTISPECIES: DUF445 domain-containing protein [Listeria]|uniref:DUF445 domain-containing protein n=1 Tax=Listeria TaxID=1637 RepID=UPI000B58A7FB|nr:MULTISPECIES: DUF445 family protein [Listeria]
MQTIVTIGLMALIGGFIGAMTNFIAIRMLFRPFEAKYIGKWRVPFTPGLIPKRRDELAKKIGEVIVEHLLTGDMIQRKLEDEALQKEVILTVQQLFEEKMALRTTPEELAELAGFKDGKERLIHWVSDKIEQELTRFLEEKQDVALQQFVPAELKNSVKKHLPDMTKIGTERVQSYILSEAGAAQIAAMLNKFFTEHGKMGSFAKLVLNVESLTEKAQKELVKMLAQPETEQMILNLCETELDHVFSQKLNDILAADKWQQFTQQIKHESEQFLRSEKWLNKPLQDNLRKYETHISEHLIPYATLRVLDFVASHSADMMKRLDISGLVEKQIETFSLEEVEAIVIDISGRELKMITYLGGVLGGFIGIIQGILAIWV